MQLKLWKNFSKRRNSTKQPADASAIVLDVKLKESTSIENPIFILAGHDFEYNYAQAFGHYYFITNIISMANNITEIHCEQDILATYKANIGNTTAYIERAASNYNSYLNDNLVSTEQRIVHRATATTDITGMETTGGCFLLRIAGGDTRGVTVYAAPTLSAFRFIFNKLSYLESEGSEWWEKMAALTFSPFDYVLSLHWCPLAYNLVALNGTATQSVDIKWYTIFLQESVTKLNSGAYVQSTTRLNVPAAHYSDYRRYNPRFSQYRMYIPGVGTTELAPELTSGPLILNYRINLENGDMAYRLDNSDGGANASLIATYNCNIFTQLQIGNDAMNVNQVASNLIGAATGIAGGNVGMALGSTISGIQNIMTPMPSANGGDASGTMVILARQAEISLTCFGSGEIPTSTDGRPCCKVLQISTLSGYVKCGGASIDLPGLSGDRDAVNSFLNSGFYYE